MATTQQTKQEGGLQKHLENNGFKVGVKKQEVMEDGKVVKSLYYLTIGEGENQIQLNVGLKTYESVKTLTQHK